MSVGTVVTYGCAENFAFAHNIYDLPQVSLTCKDSGLFTKPEVWPVCISSKPLLLSDVAQTRLFTNILALPSTVVPTNSNGEVITQQNGVAGKLFFVQNYEWQSSWKI